jgi:hypothetical protein
VSKLNLSEIAQKIMDYANFCYGYGGWDFVVETETVAEIEAELLEEKIASYTAALKHYRWKTKLLADHRSEQVAMASW